MNESPKTTATPLSPEEFAHLEALADIVNAIKEIRARIATISEILTASDSGDHASYRGQLVDFAMQDVINGKGEKGKGLLSYFCDLGNKLVLQYPNSPLAPSELRARLIATTEELRASLAALNRAKIAEMMKRDFNYRSTEEHGGLLGYFDRAMRDPRANEETEA